MKKGIIVSLILVLLFGLSSVAIACKKNIGEEKGIYYHETIEGEYAISLDGSGAFSFYIKGDSKEGKYKLKDEKLTLSFNDKEDEDLEIAYKSNTLDVKYKESPMTFYKKIEYTVSFDSNGGDDVASVKVINGKTISKPIIADKKNHTLIGWYPKADSTDETKASEQFLFDTFRVTSDLTLSAKWAQKPSSFNEYTIDFSLGSNSDEEFKSVETIGGKIYSVPTPKAIEGKTFRGWWISMYEDENMLSYRLPDNLDMTFEANTTLFALWQDSNTTMPLVEVSSSLIKWSSVEVTVYKLEIKGPVGYTNVDTTVTQTGMEMAFNTLPLGDYEITVTAQGASNSQPMTAYFKNKALNRVSKFAVIEPSTLVYNAVPNATKYLIRFECANPAHVHNHQDIDNGTSTYYNFANCTMPSDGIKFRVIAQAVGYASSISNEYLHDRLLDEIEGFDYDEATQLLSWKAVKGATNYIVSVACGNTGHEHSLVDIGNSTSYSLKECYPKSEGIIVNVYPKTVGYNYIVSQVTCNKTVLATPSNIRIESNVVKWDGVTGASSYKVKIDNASPITSSGTTQHQLPASFSQGVHQVSVMACGATDSLLSDPLTVSSDILSVTYSRNTVRWNSVYLADSFFVQVNDNEEIEVSGTETSKSITLDKHTNIIKVRAYRDGNYTSAVNIAVNAHKMEFKDNGATLASPQFYAIGDKVTLPDQTQIEKEDYVFAGWFVASGGTIANGKEYIAWYYDNVDDIELYPYWKPETSFAMYDVQGGELEAGDIGKEVFIGEAFSFSVPKATRDTNGKSFLGWFSQPDGKGTRFTDDLGIGLEVWQGKTDISVYAHWVAALKFRLEADGTHYAVQAGDYLNAVSSVVIPDQYFDEVAGVSKPVSIIDGYTFRGTTRVKYVSFPDTIYNIDATTFGGCAGLEAIEVYHVEGNKDIKYESIDGVLYERAAQGTSKELVVYPSAKEGDFIVPNSVNEIFFKAFLDCRNLTGITIHSGIQAIGDNAFEGCVRLKFVTFLSGGVDLLFGQNVFNGCSTLDEIRIPTRFKGTINNNIFEGCTGLKRIDVDETNAKYSSVDGVLYNKNKTTIQYCPLNKTGEYTIPASVSLIDYKAFNNTKLSKIIFVPRTVELTIGSHAFYSSSVNELEFRPSCLVTAIKNYAFALCTELTELTIPNSVQGIEINAFQSCIYLEKITIDGSPDIEQNAFQNCTRIAEIDFPESFYIGISAANWLASFSSLKIIRVNENNQTACDIDGVLFNKEKTTILAFPKGRTGSYTLPEKITSITSDIFNNCSLSTIIIHKDVANINSSSFADCRSLSIIEVSELNAKYSSEGGVLYNKNKTQIIHFPLAKGGDFTISASVTSVPTEMFRNSKIENVTILANINIPSRFFSSAARLKTVKILGQTEIIGEEAFNSCSELTSIILPSSLKTIQRAAFLNCKNVLSIIIPESVVTVGVNIFSGWTNSQTVYIETHASVPSGWVTNWNGYCTAIISFGHIRQG